MKYKFKVTKKGNPKIVSSDGLDSIKFYTTGKDLQDPADFESFVKECEALIRTDPRYKHYISVLKSNGFTRGAILGNLPEEMSDYLEMHHGPMFNLFEIVGIVIDHLIAKDRQFTAFEVADRVLDLHEQHQLQVVFLQQTTHQLAHDGAIFVHWKSAWGDVMGFLKRYKKGIIQEHLYTMQNYFKWCEIAGHTLDNDMLATRKYLKKQSKKNGSTWEE